MKTEKVKPTTQPVPFLNMNSQFIPYKNALQCIGIDKCVVTSNYHPNEFQPKLAGGHLNGSFIGPGDIHMHIQNM